MTAETDSKDLEEYAKKLQEEIEAMEDDEVHDEALRLGINPEATKLAVKNALQDPDGARRQQA